MLAWLLCREYNVLIEMVAETILKTCITIHMTVFYSFNICFKADMWDLAFVWL